jgi:hypothetical protein
MPQSASGKHYLKQNFRLSLFLRESRYTPGQKRHDWHLTPVAQREMAVRSRGRNMASKRTATHDPDPTPIYQIRLKGHLGRHWARWFAGMTMNLLDNGETLLTGPVLDQAALYGLLRKVRDVGLPLVAVMQVEPEPAEVPDATT